MEFDDYQHKAGATDQRPEGDDSLVIPLLGLAGEVGTLLAEHKKLVRDGKGHTEFRALVAEELGDLLWYIANLATKFDLSLSELAEANLQKVSDRWSSEPTSHPLVFDGGFPTTEQLPRVFEVSFGQVQGPNGPKVVVSDGDQRVGDPLTDAASTSDGFRYHDAIHLAFATLLGWSPVTRRNFGCKRHSDQRVDETQDGGRAIVTEEAVVAYSYAYARRHDMLRNVEVIDFEALRTIKDLTSVFEVSVRTSAEWQRAILEGFRVFRLLRQHGGGLVRGDVLERRFEFVPFSRSPVSHW